MARSESLKRAQKKYLAKKPEALKKAQKKYLAKKPVAVKKANTKSAGKRFILKYSTKKDLLEYQELIKKRLKELN